MSYWVGSSDSFLLLRSSELGLSFSQVILAYALFNAVYALGALPFGHLSDRIGRKPVIMGGWLAYSLVYFGFSGAQSKHAPWILLPIYGLSQALTEGVTKAMVSDLVPARQRAGAIGLFYTVSGLGQLLASLLVGTLWHVRLLDGRLSAGLAIGGLSALLAIPVIAMIGTGTNGNERNVDSE